MIEDHGENELYKHSFIKKITVSSLNHIYFKKKHFKQINISLFTYDKELEIHALTSMIFICNADIGIVRQQVCFANRCTRYYQCVTCLRETEEFNCLNL